MSGVGKMAQKILPTHSLALASRAAGTVASTSTGVSRVSLTGGTNYNSARCIVQVGAVTGTPDSFSIVATVQHSADNTTYTNLLDEDGNAQTITLTAASTLGSVAVNLQNANRYVGMSIVSTFVNGTSPATTYGASIVLADPTIMPLA